MNLTTGEQRRADFTLAVGPHFPLDRYTDGGSKRQPAPARRRGKEQSAYQQARRAHIARAYQLDLEEVTPLSEEHEHEAKIAEFQERGQKFIRLFKGVCPVPLRTGLYAARRKEDQ